MQGRPVRRRRGLRCAALALAAVASAAAALNVGAWRRRRRQQEWVLDEGWMPGIEPPRRVAGRQTAVWRAFQAAAFRHGDVWPPEVPAEPLLAAMARRPPAGARKAGKRFPQACLLGARPEVGDRTRVGDGRPGGISAEAVLRQVTKWAAGVRGAVVSVANATRLPEMLAEVPVAKPRWLWSAWPTADGECTAAQCERGWSERGPLLWHRDGVNASGPPQVLPAQPPAWVVAAPNAWVHDGQLYDCGLILHAGGCVPAPAEEDFQVRGREEAVAVVCDKWCSGYFHFTHEHLPRIALLLPLLRRAPQVKLVLPVDRPFVRSYVVDVLGVREEQLRPFRWFGAKATPGQTARPVTGDVFARTVFAPQPMQCGNSFTGPLLLLRRAAFKHLGLWDTHPPAGAPFRVLLALRTSSRMPAGMFELAHALRERVPEAEVVEVRPGDNLTAPDQVRAFFGADMVIGPHGANLANVMWMRYGTTALEIAAARYGNMCYYTSAARIGVRWRFVVHAGGKGDTDYELPVEEIAQHVRDAMRRAGGGRGELFES